jgi:hypothetical protein
LQEENRINLNNIFLRAQAPDIARNKNFDAPEYTRQVPDGRPARSIVRAA